MVSDWRFPQASTSVAAGSSQCRTEGAPALIDSDNVEKDCDWDKEDRNDHERRLRKHPHRRWIREGDACCIAYDHEQVEQTNHMECEHGSCCGGRGAHRPPREWGGG